MAFSSNEVKSGFVITLSFVLLLALTFVVGRFMGGATHFWKIRFGYISGLEKNAPVHFAGHEVGKVERIEVIGGEDRPVLLTVRVSDEVQLRKDSESFINTLGLMGEKFVELTPGSIQAPLLPAGSVIEGSDPVPMYLLIQKADLLADRMDEMTQSLNPLMKRLDGLITGHEEEVAKIISNINETTANLRDMTNDLKFRPWRLLRKG